MTFSKAQAIIDDDDSEGTLKDEAKEEYEDKYSDLDYLAENLANED